MTAGTIFDRTGTPLTVWFTACRLFATGKDGISALSLKRTLEIGSYQTAWAMLHRLRSVLVRPAGDPGPCRPCHRRCAGTHRAWSALQRTARGEPLTATPPVKWIPPSTLMGSHHATHRNSNVLNRPRLGRMTRKHRASGMRYQNRTKRPDPRSDLAFLLF